MMALALGALVPVVASVRFVIPAGAEIAERPLCANAPTRSVGDEDVVIDVVIPFEFLVIPPALAATGCAVSTPVYASTAPTAPVEEARVNV